mgnify:CR=1 FL=1
MSDFSKKKITQSNYRGSSKKSNSDERVVDANISELEITDEKKFLFKKKVVQELETVLNKLIPEDIVQQVLKGRVIKKIFKKLGM